MVKFPCPRELPCIAFTRSMPTLSACRRSSGGGISFSARGQRSKASLPAEGIAGRFRRYYPAFQISHAVQRKVVPTSLV